MKAIKVAYLVLLLLQIAIEVKPQNTCPQRNSELSSNQSVVMIVRTAPGTNTIIDARTGYLMPFGDQFPNCETNGMSLLIMTDAHIMDFNEDGNVDPNWWNNLYVVFNYNFPMGACNQDLNPYQIGDDYMKSSVKAYWPNAVPLVILFSPYTEYGFCFFQTFVKPEEISPDILPLKTFSISSFEYNYEWGDVSYHPMQRRVLKNAKTPQLRPNMDPVPGSTTPPDHWVKIDKLIRVNDSECPQSNMDDFNSRGAPLLLIPRDERNYPLTEWPTVFAHYSRTSLQNATCTDKDLWFVKLRDIWHLEFYSEAALQHKYSFSEMYPNDGIKNHTTFISGNDEDEEWDFEDSEGLIHSLGDIVIREGRQYTFNSGKEVTFYSPRLVFPNGFLNSQTEFRVEKGTQVRFLNRAIREGEGLGSATLRLVSTGRSAAGRGSLLELNTCDINDVKTAIQQIRATNGGRVRINAEEGDLILGYPDPFIDQRSIVVEEDGRVDIIMGKGNLYINGGIVIEPGGELNIWVSESKKLVFTNELETIRNLKFLGVLNLQAGTLEMRGNNRISGTGGRFNPRILRIEGEVGMPKAASLIVNTQETIIQNGKLVAIAEGPAGAPNGRVFIYSVTKTSVEDFSRLGPIARIRNLLRYIPTPKPDVQSMCCDEDINKEIKQQSPTDNLTPFTAKENRVVQKDTKNQTQLYPNPFSDELNISFTLESAANYLLLQVYNQQGVQVHSRQINGTSKGNQTLTWKAGSVSAGVYFIKVTDSMGKVLLQQKAVKQ